MFRLFVGMIIVGSLLIGCTHTKELPGSAPRSAPPNASIKINNTTYETVLGTYCWNGFRESTCVDTVGPEELLEGKEPIKVKSGEVITFIMDYEPMPNEFHVMQYSSDGEKEIEVDNNQFQVPDEQGVYYYVYGVWWMDEKEERLSHGDAFYNFVIEVE